MHRNTDACTLYVSCKDFTTYSYTGTPRHPAGLSAPGNRENMVEPQKGQNLWDTVGSSNESRGVFAGKPGMWVT